MVLTRAACISYLEKQRWKGIPECPYCLSTRSTPMPQEYRYHCNHCFTSYSVTVNTMFHRSHVDLLKWFRAIFLFEITQDNISIRSLAHEIQVTKKTASSMLRRIREVKQDNPKEIIHIFEFYKDALDERDIHE